jgi:Family of unknown function (DUF6527)
MGWYPSDEEKQDVNWRPDVDGLVELGDHHFLMPMYHDGKVVSFYEWHREGGSGEWHAGTLPLQFPGEEKKPGTTWDVESMDPVTLSPSVLCDCGVHGFIRSGRWIDA